MIDARHQAEQRGHFEPLGRLLYLITEHGTIQFPVKDGEGVGPDIAALLKPEDQGAPGVPPVPDVNTLLVLGAWAGLPPIRHDSSTPCPKCQTVCDSCAGKGTKICQGFGCGGRGTTDGQWILCPADGCSLQTGKINPVGCETCRGSGQVREQVTCQMCKGSKVMHCPRCKGAGKIATGYKGGQMPGPNSQGQMRMPPVCASCNGSSVYDGFVEQPVEKFTNAVLSVRESVLGYRLLGPISAFCIADHRTHATRIFDVKPDAMGDYLMLAIGGARQQKAYLVGGSIRERMTSAGARK